MPTILDHYLANFTIVNQLKNILDNLSIPLLIKIIFNPLVQFNNCLYDVSMDRHPERCIFQMVTITIFAICGLMLFCYNQKINNFFINIIQALPVSNELISILSGIISFIVFSHCGSYISQIVTKMSCNLLFGDPDFYLTKQHLIKLIRKFKAQGYTNLTEKEILQIIDFSIYNLRSKSSEIMGAKPQDWQKTLESIIYDANLEHFLDQQQALKNKVLAIKHKQTIIANYFSNKNTAEAKDTTTVTIANKSSSTCSNTSSSNISTNAYLVKYELNKFKHHYHYPKIPTKHSEELLISDYTCQLQEQKFNTDLALCPDHIMNKIIANSSSNVATYFTTTTPHNNLVTIDNPSITLTLPSFSNLKANI